MQKIKTEEESFFSFPKIKAFKSVIYQITRGLILLTLIYFLTDPNPYQIIKIKNFDKSFEITDVFDKNYSENNIKNISGFLSNHISEKIQILKLLSPHKKCTKDQPRTVFFNYSSNISQYKNKNYNNKEESELKIEKVILLDKNYFLTYFTFAKFTFEAIQTILNSNNFIRIFSVPWYLTNYLIFFSYRKYEVLEESIKSPFTKINKIPGHRNITYKDLLYEKYKLYHSEFPDDYNYMSETFILPHERSLVNKKFKNYKLSMEDLWLVKPKRGSLGKGIFFFNNLKSLRETHYDCLITKYISNPHLLHGKKYDLRVYVLVSSAAPLKIYLYKEGLVRLASKKYSLTKESITNTFIHLTNVAVNKNNNSTYKPSEDKDSENFDKWTFETYEKYLKKTHPENPHLYEKIKAKMIDVIIKTMIMGQNHFYEEILASNYDISNFYQIFGFDILLDENFNIYVLEVNRKPQMILRDEVDNYVKLKLVEDTFNIVGFVPFNREKRTVSLDGIDVAELNKNETQKAVDDSLCEFYRPMGNYERIFPLKNNIDIYRKFFINNNRYNEMLWKSLQ